MARSGDTRHEGKDEEWLQRWSGPPPPFASSFCLRKRNCVIFNCYERMARMSSPNSPTVVTRLSVFEKTGCRTGAASASHIFGGALCTRRQNGPARTVTGRRRGPGDRHGTHKLAENAPNEEEPRSLWA